MRHTLLIASLFIVPVLLGEEAPKLPEGIDPMPTELNARMKELLGHAEKYRGLKCLHAVPGGSLKEDALRLKMRAMIGEELPEKKMLPYEAALKAFGFIPEKMKLGTYLPELLTSQVGGYYDPRRQYLIVVQREGGLLGKEAKAKLGEALAARMEETVLVHEFTHAIQDQHFDLKKYMIEDAMSDKAAARQAVVEGDATLTMYNFFGQMKMEELPMAEEIVTKMMKDPRQLMQMTPDMPGAKEMEDAPPYFRDTLLFSYLQGFVFCMNAKKTGGQALLDVAFTKDPPHSTEQIMHPEKWHTKRDDPIEITLPDLTTELPGWKSVNEGTLGELGIKIFLSNLLDDAEKGGLAAEGWGGDRFVALEKEGALALCWVTDWDKPADAVKFNEACGKLGEGWKVATPSAQRVTLTRTKLAAEAVTALHKKLNEAKAVMPENKAMDFAALGVTRRKAGEMNLEGLPDLEKVVGKDGKPDIDKILNDPNVEKMLKELGGNDKDGGTDMKALLNSPMVKGMMKNMLSQKTPAGKLSEDGKTYVNETLGVALTLPDAAKGWTMSAKGPTPMTALIVSNPGETAQLQIATQMLPLVMELESMGPMLEMGVKMMVKQYKKFKDGPVGEGVSKGYELQYGGDMFGQKVHTIQRVYMRGQKMMIVSANAPESEWAANEKAFLAMLEAVKLSEPKAEVEAEKK